ncbi:hypothetical protein COCNU_scaffold005880G000010 [Cocos nucifera]|nr:hypothetical protein [Cocos nucifera]
MTKMDAKAIEILSKGLQAHKRKDATPGEPSKKARTDIPSSVVPIDAAFTTGTTMATKVALVIEVPLMAEAPPAVKVAGSLVLLSPSVEAQIPEDPSQGEKEEKKRVKGAIRKSRCKVTRWAKQLRRRVGGTPSTTTKLSEMGHQLLGYIRSLDCSKLELVRVWEGCQAEVEHLLKEKDEVGFSLREKSLEVEGLKEMLHREKKTSAELKAALALEEERRKKIEAELAELKERILGQISKAMSLAIEEFKVSFEMRDLNMEFSREAF